MIDFIIDRTNSGVGKDGKDFPKYSKEYMESFDFKIAGKGKTPDLRLTGEMLDSLKVISATKGKIVIGYDVDSNVAGRVEGNTIGSYGKSANPSKARNFLDLSDKEVQRILNEYPVSNAQERLQSLSASELARIIAKQIVGDLEFDNNDT